jgi:multicomponent Na+:H+ antiporter subunit D
MRDLLLSMALPAVLMLPLVWGILSLLVRQSVVPVLSGCGAFLQLTASLALWWQVRSEGGYYYAVGDWPMPLGIGLRVDGLAAIFVLLTAVVAATCAVHAHFYLAARVDLRTRPALQRYYWPLLWFMWAGLNSIWVSADLFNLYVGLELVALCAVGLVAITGEPRALASALRYLLAALTGSLAYLLGVALIYGSHGLLSIPDLAGAITLDSIEAGVTVSVATVMMTTGLLFKTALFPLHSWLPPAHGGALAPVSALLSALVIKASFYILLRLWLDLGFADVALANGLGVLGTLAIVWGSWKALHQKALKMVVAYSTVAQIGYFFLFFPLFAGAADEAAVLARDGIVLLVLAHALAKAAMFLAAGNIVASLVGKDRVDDLLGISRFRPLSLFSFALAGVTLMGLPPSGGFTAKWLMLQSALISGHWYWVLVILLGSLGTAAYLFRIFHKAFREGPEEDVFNNPPLAMEAVPMGLAVASVALGLVAVEVVALLPVVAAFAGAQS